MTLEQCLAVAGLSEKEKGTIKATFGRNRVNKFSQCADENALNELLAKNRAKADGKKAIEDAVAEARKNGASTEQIVEAIQSIYREKQIQENLESLRKLGIDVSAIKLK